MQKQRKWFKPLFEFEDDRPKKKVKTEENNTESIINKDEVHYLPENQNVRNINSKNWMKNFDPVKVEDLAVHNKKVQEVEEWLSNACKSNASKMLLLSGPVGAGKTATIHVLATKYNIKVAEWITPLDIEYPSEFGDYEFKESQSKKFLEFIINSANFTSLLDNNSCKLVLVEDFPNTFLRSSTEFADVLFQYQQRALSPIVFICSESHTDNKNTAISLFTPALKEKFNIQQISFNSVSVTGLKAALKRASDIMSRRHAGTYSSPPAELVDSVVNTSAGDVRSAILNLHFACLKGSTCDLETSVIKEKETKSKNTKRKKNTSSKFMSLGKDQTVSILHGVGRVLNPKVSSTKDGEKTLVHTPRDIIEQFVSSPNSFLGFLEENYLSHFSCMNDAERAAGALSDGDFMLAEWREKLCHEYGLYVAVAGLMLENKAPVSAWNPVRGPKSMKVQFPTQREMSQLDPNALYKGKVLVSDYLTYCKVIGGGAGGGAGTTDDDDDVIIEE